MVVAAIVEAVRLKEVARLGMYNSKAPVPISVFWLIPQYFIIGAAEIMVNIGTLEMFYSEVFHRRRLAHFRKFIYSFIHSLHAFRSADQVPCPYDQAEHKKKPCDALPLLMTANLGGRGM
jgi:hypothetical protein